MLTLLLVHTKYIVIALDVVFIPPIRNTLCSAQGCEGEAELQLSQSNFIFSFEQIQTNRSPHPKLTRVHSLRFCAPAFSFLYPSPQFEMVLRIRLARFGTKRKPIYNIVLAQAKSARDSKPMEVLGTFDPVAKVPLAQPDTPEFNADGTKFEPKKFKDVKLDSARTKYWLGVGAQPSEPVGKLL